MTEHTILAPIELTDTELDAVSGGSFQTNVAVAAIVQVQKVTFNGQKIGIAVETAVGVIVQVGNNINVDVNVL
jgi:hypothetical protein